MSEALLGTSRRSNRRSGWVLVSIALVFFAGIVIKTWLVGR
jgi:hypothetical protein